MKHKLVVGAVVAAVIVVVGILAFALPGNEDDGSGVRVICTDGGGSASAGAGGGAGGGSISGSASGVTPETTAPTTTAAGGSISGSASAPVIGGTGPDAQKCASPSRTESGSGG